jgi:hypothetical protein
MASKPLQAAWRRSTLLWCWMDMQADECSGPALMCVDLGVLVGGGQGLGQGLSVSKLSAALV